MEMVCPCFGKVLGVDRIKPSKGLVFPGGELPMVGFIQVVDFKPGAQK